MSAKYVIIDHKFLELAVVFNPILNHSDFKHLGKIVSAGSVQINGDDVVCYGSSVTLKLASRGEVDARVVKQAIRNDF